MPHINLTPRQLKFIELIIAGKHQREAYLEAYPKSKLWKENVVDKCAVELMKNSKVSGRIAELRAKTDAKSVETIDKMVNELNRAIEIAFEQGNTSSISSLVNCKAKILGLLTDKIDSKNSVIMEMPTIKINDKELIFDIGKEPIKK